MTFTPTEPFVPVGALDCGPMRGFLTSRTALALGVLATLVIPVATLPQLPRVDLAPALAGLGVWTIGKYLLCAVRWQVLAGGRLSWWWHARVNAESEIFGLVTPGHVGGDVWRARRLARESGSAADAAASVAAERVLAAGAVATITVVVGAGLPVHTLVPLGVLLLLAGTALGVVAVARPGTFPMPTLPGPRALVTALALGIAYELTIVAGVYGAVLATGHQPSFLAVLTAFFLSQPAGVVPGMHGASPRDAALVVALAALGIPLVAATGAVALKGLLVWLPALALGGTSLLARGARPVTGPVPRMPTLFSSS